jgi:hypothetical protein
MLENTSLDNMDAFSSTTRNTAAASTSNYRKESCDDAMDRSDRDSTSNKAIASASIGGGSSSFFRNVSAAGSGKSSNKKKVSIEKGGLLSADMEECSVSVISEKSVNPSVTALAGSIK